MKDFCDVISLNSLENVANANKQQRTWPFDDDSHPRGANVQMRVIIYTYYKRK